ncbi:MAG: lytic murein transglycosylase [Magnetococcus sp. DMHC-1]|nr:lytic murein transglycosylase [Magnetococcales bacterium]
MLRLFKMNRSPVSSKASIAPGAVAKTGLTAGGITRRDWLGGMGGVFLAFWSTGRAWSGEDVVDIYPWMRSWVEQDGLDRGWLNRLFFNLDPYNLAISLMDHQAESKPYYTYRKLFVNKRTMAQGRVRLLQNRMLLQQINERYGVPGEFLVALWGIESRFGNNLGKHPVLRVLFTLARGYPRRAVFYQDQLRQFLLLCQEEGWDPEDTLGSYAGAIGQVQMIPGTLRRYAVDFDGDGKRDVFNDTDDVLASIASFLRGQGWRTGGLYVLPVEASEDMDKMVSPDVENMRPWREWSAQGVRLASGQREPDPDEDAAMIMLEEESGPRYYMVFHNFRVVTRWNRSRRFAMVVRELAVGISRAM